MKIICIGRNYIDHAKELKNPLPEEPVFFCKPDTALLIRNKPFYYPPFSSDVHYELEVVIKICKNGKHIQEKFAHTYFNEVALGIDFTARDVQERCKKNGLPWEIAKAFDSSAPIGKFINKDDLGHIQSLNFYLLVNDQKVQEGNTRDMIFSVHHIISYVSKYMTLKMGDYIYTGTPAGVGPVKIGDKLQAFLEGSLNIQCLVK